MPWLPSLGRQPPASESSGAPAPPAPPPNPTSPPNVVLAASAADDPPTTRWIGYGLAGASMVLAVYDLVLPSILAAAGLLVLPLAVLALVIGSPTSFESRSRRSGRRSLNGLVLLPFVAVVMPNIHHAQIDPFAPLAPAAVAAVVMAPLAWLVKGRPGVASPWVLFGFLIVCAAAYGYGATATVNIQFDPSAGTILPVPVLDKHEVTGRSTSYYLDLPAWGPMTQPNSVEVSGSTYRTLNAGDTVCIAMHPGLLKLAWFSADVCATPTPPAAPAP
jgi:hypothetical protein